MSTAEKLQSKFGSRRNGRGKNAYGKGDAPRNNWSQKFRDNYDEIKWTPKTRQTK